MAHGDITHFEIPVSDKEAATSFYADAFGWQISAPPGFEGYPMWQNPNQVSGGGLVDPSETYDRPIAYVEVDSIDDVIAKTTAAGGSVADPKTSITDASWSAIITDPYGNKLGLFEGTVEM